MLRHPPRGRRGTEAVEFALILPVFVAILAAMLDFGWVFFHQSALDSSASIGCRAGALVDPGIGEANLTELQQVALDAMTTALRQSGAGDCGANCSTQVEVSGSRPGRSLKCTMTRDIEPLIGLAVRPLTLESDIAVRLEWQREP